MLLIMIINRETPMLSRTNLLLFTIHFNFNNLRGDLYIITDLPGPFGTTCDHYHRYGITLDNKFLSKMRRRGSQGLHRSQVSAKDTPSQPVGWRLRGLFEEKGTSRSMLGSRRV
ncbi:MAG: hypothetical protein [Cressdnaviricota sp.]|nr:MAG: hypothetical protein [Cressdnaviricota sp.]